MPPVYHSRGRIMTGASTARTRVHASRMLLAAATLSALGAPGARGQTLVLADGRNAEHTAWQVKGDFKRGKDISGLACADDRSCFAVTDEKSAVLPFALDRPARTVTVAPSSWRELGCARPGGWLPAEHD